MKKNKVFIETLGCPKNINDSQFAMGVLLREGYEKANTPEEADIVMVNTCGFIEDAKKESIDRIFHMANTKKDSAKLVVSGCLAERYIDELIKEIPEADLFIGVNQYGELPAIFSDLNTRRAEIKPYNPEYLEKTVRDYGENPYTSTIKIAEGCNNRCTYCIIPFIRGNYRSKKIEDVLNEAEELALKGCKELILIAQDTGYYGKDLYGEVKLPALLKDLCKIEGIEWIRLMYCYDERITDELIKVMAEEKKICNYIDIPLQHGSDKILRDMARHSDYESIKKTISKLRSAIPDIVIRTSLIVGFPGETEDDFSELIRMVDEMKFGRMGAFKYSREEGTKAGERQDQIPEDIKEARWDILMRRQMDISLSNNRKLIGKKLKVLVDEVCEDGSYLGRTEYDAPEIDNSVIFTSPKSLSPGDMVHVKILDAFDYDLAGIQED